MKIRSLEGSEKEKSQSGQKTPKSAVSTKIDADVLRLAKTLASYRGVDLYDYLSDILAEHVGNDFRNTFGDVEGK